MKPSFIAISIICACLLAACGPDPVHPDLLLTDGWVRAMPPGSSMTAAYGRFTNQGATTIEITSFRSDSYDAVTLHRTVNQNGLSRMEQQTEWSQSSHTAMVLEPGGYHLMLMNPTREVRPGDSIGLTLISATGEEFPFELPVETR
jgi:copper(I)-binding protein